MSAKLAHTNGICNFCRLWNGMFGRVGGQYTTVVDRNLKKCEKIFSERNNYQTMQIRSLQLIKYSKCLLFDWQKTNWRKYSSNALQSEHHAHCQWDQQPVFKSWMKFFAFHLVLMHLGKLWIHLFIFSAMSK